MAKPFWKDVCFVYSCFLNTKECSGTWKTKPSKQDWKGFVCFFLTPEKYLIMQPGQLNRSMNEKLSRLKNTEGNGG